MNDTPDHTKVTEKPFAPASERNREPILEVLRIHFADRQRVLEIGSGTGQHAVHFAAALAHLVWQTSERPEHLAGLRTWLDEAELPNTPPPLGLDVTDPAWPMSEYDAAFSANTLHIMAWSEVEAMFRGLARALKHGAIVAVYGPFNRDGHFTSESNQAFDRSLKQRAAHMGIRDLAAVDALGATIGLQRIADHAMPANNRLVVWRKQGLGARG